MGISPKQISGVLEKQKNAGMALPLFVLWTPHYEQILYGNFYPAPTKGEVL